MASSAKEGRIWGQLSLKGGDFLESSGAERKTCGCAWMSGSGSWEAEGV